MKKFVAIAAATLVSAVVVAAPSTHKAKKHETVETTAATASAPATASGVLAPATASAASN